MTTTPAWLAAARALIGVRETPGAGNNPIIMGWAAKLGARVLGMIYNADATPWCGLTIAHVMQVAGIAPPPIAVRAKSWATWGVPLPSNKVAPGAVLVFERPGGGHVGLYVGENDRSYRVLGGNQGDRVCETWIEKRRCVAIRWPSGVAVVGGPVKLAGSGAASKNEA